MAYATDHIVASARGARELPLRKLGVFFAWLAVIIYASSNSVVTMLVDIGEENILPTGHNAITYSNLLVLGSLLSVIPIAFLFRRDFTLQNIQNLRGSDWRVLTLSAFLSSALTPGLFFYALAYTSVTNVVLISRIEPPLFLLATWLFLNERFSRRAMTAGVVALSGALVVIGLRDGNAMFELGRGEWAAIGATLSYIASTLVSRKGLRDIPTGIFTVYRTLVGTAFYAVLAMLIFGRDVFADIFAPVLWTHIWVYVAVVLVLGQVAWTMALKYARTSEITLATSFAPIAAIMIAMALLGENPGPGLLPGAALILLAIFIGREALGRTSDAPENPLGGPTKPVIVKPSAASVGMVHGAPSLNIGNSSSTNAGTRKKRYPPGKNRVRRPSVRPYLSRPKPAD
ncbi:MAG: DMT family transporter [Pseudomonadota bacterium]